MEIQRLRPVNNVIKVVTSALVLLNAPDVPLLKLSYSRELASLSALLLISHLVQFVKVFLLFPSACPPSCAKCSSSDICEECKPNYLFDPASKACLSSCPPGLYRVESQCLACS